MTITTAFNWSPASRPIKERTRQTLMQDMTPKKSVLLMPGNLARDLEVAIQHKVLNRRSRIVCVEKDNAEISSLSRRIQRIVPKGFRKPELHHQDVFKIKLDHPVDFAWIDLCGNLRKKDIPWLQNELVPNLMPDAELAFTFSIRTRGNNFIQGVTDYLNKHEPDYVFTESGKLPIYLDPSIQSKIITFIAILRLSLYPCGFDTDVFRYRDIEANARSHNMVLFRLYNFQKTKAKPVVARLDDLLLKPPAPRSPVMTTATLTPTQVVQAGLEAKTPGTKAKFTRWLNSYLKQEKKKGRNTVQVAAGIKASITRKRNGN
jgi:hypothetical protein